MRRREKDTATRGRVGIRWRLFVCLALFTAVILVTLWLFQVRLLSYFYEKEKFDEITEAADGLQEHLLREDLENLAREHAKEQGICVCIFRVEGQDAIRIANADAAPNCVIHHLGDVVLTQL